MNFELSIAINCAPATVFAFLRDIDRHPQKPDSPVLALEKTTPGPVGVGTRYREVVQMLPFVRGEILSEITRYEPSRYLEEDFAGAGMAGHLAYEILPEAQGARLIQREVLHAQGLLKPLAPIIGRVLAPRLQARLEAIRALLESASHSS
jgi:hypothetical protein